MSNDSNFNQFEGYPFEMLPFHFEETFDEASYEYEAEPEEQEGEARGRRKLRVTGGSFGRGKGSVPTRRFGQAGRKQAGKTRFGGLPSKNRITGQPGQQRPRPKRHPRRPRYPWGLPLTVVRDWDGFGSADQGQGSEFVRWVQSALNQVMNLDLPVNGIMDVQTRSAVRSFQEKNNLPADGIVGPDTRQALQTARAGSSSPGGVEPVTSMGANGNGKTSSNGNGKAPVEGADTATEPAPAPGSQPPGAEEAEGWWDTIKDFISGPGIIDRTSFSPKEYRIKERDISKVKALVLHQMAFSRGSDPNRYNKVKAHYAILPDGKILQLHPNTSLLYASNGFNNGSVAVEFAGNFPSVKGKCWEAAKYGCHQLTQAQIDSGRHLIRHLIRQIGLTTVLTHRQSSDTRENDPGPDIWYNVGQWAVDNLGLKDGGAGFKIGSGNPIPDTWRTWGKIKPQSPELEWQGEAETTNTQFSSETGEGEAEDEWWDWLRGALGFGSGQAPSGISTNSQPSGPVYQQTQQSATASRLAALRSNIIKIAKTEWNRWNSGGKKFEKDPQMRSILQDYWQTGAGMKVNPADLGSTTWQNSWPWSAAFISWVMKKAGAGNDFAYSASHAVYTKAAKDNRLARNANPFKAYRISEAKPEPGDIVCKSRSGSGATYDNIAPGMSTHCDIVTDVQPGKITTIGGNLSDSVSTSTVTTDTNGYINARDYFAVIKLGSTMP